MALVIIQAITWFRTNPSAFGFHEANPSAFGSIETNPILLVLLKPIQMCF
jgi:hypothetical protein